MTDMKNSEQENSKSATLKPRGEVMTDKEKLEKCLAFINKIAVTFCFAYWDDPDFDGVLEFQDKIAEEANELLKELDDNG